MKASLEEKMEIFMSFQSILRALMELIYNTTPYIIIIHIKTILSTVLQEQNVEIQKQI